MTADAGARVSPRRFSRGRLALFGAVERAARLAGGRAFYRRRFLSAGRLAVRREEVRVDGLDPALDGHRLGVVSDIHAGSFLGPGDLEHAAQALEEARPDHVLLLGDFIVHAPEEFPPIAADVGRLARAAREGAFAVFGNHDYRGRRETEMADALAPFGVVFLRNACRRFERGAGALAFVGIEDAEEAHVLDVEAARRDVRAGDVEVVLSHNPGAAPTFARPRHGARGAALVLSGHTHGVQVDLPYLRRLGPPHPGLRVDLGATTLLVTRGVGAVGLPLRVGAPAEVLLVTLRARACDDALS